MSDQPRFEAEVDDGELTIKSDYVRTVDDLIRVAKVDLDRYRIVRSKVNAYQTYSNQSGLVQLHQVEVKLERIEEVRVLDQIIENLLREIRDKATPRVKVSKSKLKIGRAKKPERLGLIAVLDAHFGKYYPGLYNNEIASKTYLQATKDLLDDLLIKENVDKVVLRIGDDLIHVDQGKNQTTAGTDQDVDGLWQEAFDAAFNSVLESIDYVASNVPVDVIVIPGNHDRTRTYILGRALEAIYSKTDDVNVISERKLNYRKYYQYGKNLIGFTHGDRIKTNQLPGLMATEAKDMWSESEFREFLLGHYHQFKTEEVGGVQITTLPSISPPDDWHDYKGFTTSNRAATGLVYDKRGGRVALRTWYVR